MKGLEEERGSINSKYTDSSWKRRRIQLGAILAIVATVLIGGPSTLRSSLDLVDDDVHGIVDEDLDGVEVPPSGDDLDGDNDQDGD